MANEPASEYLRDPDVQLMLRVRDGDETAFSQLMGTYQDRLVAVLSHQVADNETAEDLAQEVFLRIFRGRRNYEPTAKFSTWMFRIANNLASNSRRDKGRKREVPLAVSESVELSTPSGPIPADKSSMMPTRQLDKRELQRVVRESLHVLNDRQRMAVLLHKFEDMSYADIGAAMEMSEAAVKSLLSRARENLRTVLEPYMAGESV